LTLEIQSPAGFEFISKVERAYSLLMETALADRETGLGGALLYAGEVDDEGRAVVAAANIAGAASLAATADRAAQKQAIRDGIADFLVNSLDESLRILKNQLRKREAVAVCVALVRESVEREMEVRGVQADLRRVDAVEAGGEQSGVERGNAKTLVTWRVAAAPAQWLPKLDAIALDCLDEDAWRTRRWLRLGPRYLGKLARGFRMASCERKFATGFVERVRQQVESGEFAVAVEIIVRDERREEEHKFAPSDRRAIG
jgi:hypothetical protein